MPFNENQPRVPAGHENGGQWTAGDATAAIQNAASDKTTVEQGIGSEKWFNESIKQIQNGEFNSMWEIPDGPLKTALLQWVGSATNIREMDDFTIAKQLFLRGVEQTTPYKELYRGESYYVPYGEQSNSTFDDLEKNVYKPGNILDYSKTFTIKNQDGSGTMNFDNRLVSFTKNQKVALDFSKINDVATGDDGYNGIIIKLKNDNGIKGFNISYYSGNEQEVVVGDHKKYLVDDVKTTIKDVPVYKLGTRPKKTLEVTLKQL